MNSHFLQFLSLFLLIHSAFAEEGFTESAVTLYGKIYNVVNASPYLLQDGELEFVFVNQENASNTVSLTAGLKPVGIGVNKPYSYTIDIPIKFLPKNYQAEQYLSVGQLPTQFRLQSILLDGTPVTVQDGSQEFFELSMAERAAEIRLDLYVEIPLVDLDQDGLPDTWEERYDLSTNSPSDLGDEDGDGWNNFEEFENGTDPTVDNRIASIVVERLPISEFGEVGLWFQVIDSDSTVADLSIQMDISSLGADAELAKDGVVVAGTSVSLNYGEILSGSFTIQQTTPWVGSKFLNLEITDPETSTVSSFSLPLTTEFASATDGSDAFCWYDAASLTGSSTLAQLDDRSGNELHASQPSPAYQPLVNSRANGLSEISFTESGAHLFLPSNVFLSNEQTILFVAQTDDEVGRFDERFLWSSPQSDFLVEDTQAGAATTHAVRASLGNQRLTSWNPLGQAVVTLTVNADRLTLQQDWNFAFSSELNTPDPLRFSTLGLKRTFMDAAETFSDTGFRGSFQELIVYPYELPEQRLRKLQNYLKSKWEEAIIWDFGEQFSAIDLASDDAPKPLLIRGGWHEDRLEGGAFDDIISGGARDDTLIGNAGADTFLYGILDIGADRLPDFEPSEDQIDLSKLFVGSTANPLDALTIGYEIDITVVPPRIHSKLNVARADGKALSILIEDITLNQNLLTAWIVEGIINTGRAVIPQSISLEASATSLVEGGDSLSLTITRSGAGISGSTEVPIALLENSEDSSEFVIEGETQPFGNRAVVTLGRNETSKTVELRAIADGVSEGVENWEIVIAPTPIFTVESAPVSVTVSDASQSISLRALQNEVIQSDNTSGSFSVIRSGVDTDQPVTVTLAVESSLAEGVAYSVIPRTLSFVANELEKTLTVEPLNITTAGLAKVTVIQHGDYAVVSPSEILLRLLPTFAASEGYFELSANPDEPADEQRLRLQEHFFGTSETNFTSLTQPIDLGIRIDEGHAILLANQNRDASDVIWTIQCSNDLENWVDVSGDFTDIGQEAGSARREIKNVLSVNEAGLANFYRIIPSLITENLSLLNLSFAQSEGDSLLAEQVSGAWILDETGQFTLSENLSSIDEKLILSVKGEGEISFDVSLEGSAGDQLLVRVDGAIYDTVLGGEQRSITLPLYPGLVKTIEIENLGSGSPSISNFTR